MNCPRCQSTLHKATSFAGGDCETWWECPKCNTFVNDYRPLPHQQAVHEDRHRIIGNFGGYGTGKTTTSRFEIIKHMLITPNANVVVGANIMPQYEQTIKRELENDLPAAFVKDYSVQKATMDLLNGSRIIWRPFDDPEKLRSLNLTMFVILEASEVKGETYRQLMTRLRNTTACTFKKDAGGNIIYKITKNGTRVPIIEHDWRKGIIESNPDAGWVRNEILLRSQVINQYGTYFEYLQDEEKIVPSMSSHVAATNVNEHLPADFESDLRKRNPDWWIKRYLEGSFQYSEGLVYPNAASHVVQPFVIPRHWKRVVAFDYGISDLAAFVFAAIDEKRGIVYIYKVVSAKDRNVEQLAKMYHLAAADIPAGGLFCNPIIDPKSGPKRDYNLKTLSEQFLDYDISFIPGQINVDARIYGVNTYLELGKLKIFENCTLLIEELQDYRFKERTLNDTDKKILAPIDKNNHAINAMEWIIMELPRDPRQLLLGVYGRSGELIKSIQEAEREAATPWQFADEPDERRSTSWW